MANRTFTKEGKIIEIKKSSWHRIRIKEARLSKIALQCFIRDQPALQFERYSNRSIDQRERCQKVFGTDRRRNFRSRSSFIESLFSRAYPEYSRLEFYFSHF